MVRALVAISAKSGLVFSGQRAAACSPALPVPTDDRWNVKQESGDIVSTHDTQAEAEQAAKEWARAEGGGEVFTHRDEGGVLPHPQRRRCLTGPLADHRPDLRNLRTFPRGSGRVAKEISSPRMRSGSITVARESAPMRSLS